MALYPSATTYTSSTTYPGGLVATAQWQILRAATSQAGSQWQILRVATAGATTPRQWQILRVATTNLTTATLGLSRVGPYDPGVTVTITATRGGAAPASRIWRIASSTGVTTTLPTISNVGDVATIRTPISATDNTVTVGYKPSDGGETFVTLNTLRAVDWVWWNGARRPAVWHVVAL